MKEKIEDLQKRVNSTYYQKFTINDDLTIIPGSTAQVNIDHMKKYFLDEKLVGKTVLDIGCSHGLFSILCAQLGAKVVGIEPYEPAFEIATGLKELLKLDIEYKKMEFSNKIVKWRRFDYIICCSVYHYMYSTYKNHDEIFKILYATGADVFFEDGTGIDDPCTKEFLERAIPEEIENYNNANIILAASNYFDVQFLGKHENGTRLIYWLKRKPQNNPAEYSKLYTIFSNSTTGVVVDKVEKFGNFYCRKHVQNSNMLLYETIKESWMVNFPKISDIENIVKVEEIIWDDDNKQADIIMEFLEEFTPIPDLNIPLTQKRNLFFLILNSNFEMMKRGCIIWDFGPGNFMIDNKHNMKIIDLDALLPYSKNAEMMPVHENFYKCRFIYWSRMIEWLFTEDQNEI